jgi:hypothetical protein
MIIKSENMANAYKWLIGKRAIVELKTQYTIDGKIIWATANYIGIKTELEDISYTYVIPYDTIFIIELKG